MSEAQLNQLAAAVRLAMERVDLTRSEQIQVLERTVEQLRIVEAVDEEALMQLVREEVN
jgi:hypothetical protein